MRVLFLSDTHLGLDLPSRPRIERPRRGEDFFRMMETALAPALAGEVDVVVHGGDLHYRSRIPVWLAEAALAPLVRVARAGVPVLLVLGNHERSRLPYPLLARHERLFVFDRPRTVTLEARGVRVAFTGFPYAQSIRARLPELLHVARPERTRADLDVLCLHHCIEGSRCGPNDFEFTTAADVARVDDLSRGGFAAVLSGHIHRHQVLRPADAPPIIYAGSTERTSFAEAGEAKGYVTLELGRGPVAPMFHELPARPMLVRDLRLAATRDAEARQRIRDAVEASPANAVLQLRVDAPSPWLAAAALRDVAGARNVSVRVEGQFLRAPRTERIERRTTRPRTDQLGFEWR